jgi:hypothetical protein
MGGRGLDSYGSGYEEIAGYFEHDNELSSYIKQENFLDYLRNCYLIRKDFVPFIYVYQKASNMTRSEHSPICVCELASCVLC